MSGMQSTESTFIALDQRYQRGPSFYLLSFSILIVLYLVPAVAFFLSLRSERFFTLSCRLLFLSSSWVILVKSLIPLHWSSFSQSESPLLPIFYRNDLYFVFKDLSNSLTNFFALLLRLSLFGRGFDLANSIVCSRSILRLRAEWSTGLLKRSIAISSRDSRRLFMLLRERLFLSFLDFAAAGFCSCTLFFFLPPAMALPCLFIVYR